MNSRSQFPLIQMALSTVMVGLAIFGLIVSDSWGGTVPFFMLGAFGLYAFGSYYAEWRDSK